MAIEPWIVTALISAASCVIAIVATSHTLSKDKDAKDGDVARKLSDIDTKLAVLDEKVETLSERVQRHNGVIERVFRLEEREKLNEQEIREIKAGGTDD